MTIALLFLYMKHDPTSSLPSFLWNWSKTSLTSDQVFIASCVSWALRDEIRWPNVMERQALVSMVPRFPECIGIIDGTLVKICRPWKNPSQEVVQWAQENVLYEQHCHC